MMSINSGVCQIYTPHHSVHLHYTGISVHPASLLKDVLGWCDQGCLEMHWETDIEWTLRCTWSLGSSQFGDAFGDRDRVSSEMHLEARIERVWRWIWRLRSSELRGTLGLRDRVSLEMHLESEIVSDMYFSQRKPPGLSERMWSVILDASISGESQTLGGHSCRHSE